MENELSIGMAFSGGGYRAATYDLGTLSFLNSIRLEDGRTLLECVKVLTSVSGGSIPALKYMLACAKGQPIDEMIQELFDFLCNGDLITPALQSIRAEKDNRDASSIKMMADIYDQCLFDGATMGDLIDNFDRIPVKDYTALATDFDHSLSFRFRVTSGITTQGERMSYGVFGNNKYNIGQGISRYIRLGEAMACSSCFPSGFEPMMFPDDFQVSQHPELVARINKRFGIMDGGILDNQGIEPLKLAEKRLFKHRNDRTRTDKALDLIIVSDVSDGDINECYAPCEQFLPKWLGNLTIGRLRNYGLISEVVAIVLFIAALVAGNGFAMGAMSVILAIVTLMNVIGALLKNKMFGAIEKTFIGNRARFITHLKFASAEAMLMNRAKSLVTLTSEIFLNRLRSINYSSIYNDSEWYNRLVTSNIHAKAPIRRDGTSSPWENELIPSDAMLQKSALAASMGTTLWFTPQDKAAGLPQAILAAGQFHICRSLLSYIHHIEQDPTNTTEAHSLLIACKPQMLDAWKRFKQDPLWMVPKV